MKHPRQRLDSESQNDVWESALSPDGHWLAFREGGGELGRGVAAADGKLSCGL